MVARRVVSLRRGSMTIIFAPARIISLSCMPGFWPKYCFEITGLPPVIRNRSSVSGRIRPPSHLPCSASARLMLGWSSVAIVKNIGEPSARSSDSITGVVATCSMLGLPMKPATARGPCLATISLSFSAISKIASPVAIGV